MRYQKALAVLAIVAAIAGCDRGQSVSRKEPAMVVYRGADGRALTMDDLRGATGSVRYEIVGGEPVPAEAEALHGQARQKAGSGDYGDAERLAAIERGLAADPDAETRGILLINKALIIDRKGDREGAVRMLGELVLDPSSTLSTEQLAKAALASVIGK